MLLTEEKKPLISMQVEEIESESLGGEGTSLLYKPPDKQDEAFIHCRVREYGFSVLLVKSSVFYLSDRNGVRFLVQSGVWDTYKDT